MSYIVRPAVLDDWPSLKKYWYEFKEGPHGKKIEGDIEVLQAFFLSSLSDSKFWIQLLMEEESIKGVCVVNMAASTKVSDDKLRVEYVPAGFVRAVIITPGVKRRESDFFDQTICEEARRRGCTQLFGNCPTTYKIGAANRRYGIEAVHLVVCKKL